MAVLLTTTACPEPWATCPPVIEARETTVPTPRMTLPEAAGSRQSTLVSRFGETAYAIGRSERRTCSPTSRLSTSAVASQGSEVEFCRSPVWTSPNVSMSISVRRAIAAESHPMVHLLGKAAARNATQTIL